MAVEENGRSPARTNEPVLDGADAIDFDADDVSMGEIAGRGHAHADAGGRARCDDVAGMEGDAP